MDDLFLNWHSQIMDPQRIPVAIAAMLLVAVVGMISGPLAGNANSFFCIVFDKAFGRFGDRLNRVERPRSDLIFRGFVLSAFTVFLALLLGEGLADYAVSASIYGVVEIICLSLVITVGSVWFILLRLYFALEKKEIKAGAYYGISVSARTNLSLSDDFGITRTAISYMGRSFDKGLVAPVFWYLLGGLPLAFVYAALAALAWRFGKDGFSKGFGSVPLAMERLMGFVPALFSAALITCAGLFTPTASLSKGVASWLGHKNRAKYEQGGFPLSALAWSLNISLGGASQDITGSAIKSEWTGPEGASARIDHSHLRRALYISLMAHLLFLATLLGAYIWSGRL